ncbi:hypothetical protein C8R45DRAFT_1028837 [Mycena sanguinolenta]|nr:hypothetical protein C8R45DRAFT_1028837 [Mycena sanguinolenta]
MECMRARAKMPGFMHIPWRANKLTMLLTANLLHMHSTFINATYSPSSTLNPVSRRKAIIIAHISPHIRDSVHSTNIYLMLRLSRPCHLSRAAPRRRRRRP